MGVAIAHPISPELVLVCPELRAAALALLPPFGPDVLFEVEPSAVHVPLAAIRERPGLVLVDETQRVPLPLAFAAYVVEALVLGALRGAAVTAVIAAAAFLLAR